MNSQFDILSFLKIKFFLYRKHQLKFTLSKTGLTIFVHTFAWFHPMCANVLPKDTSQVLDIEQYLMTDFCRRLCPSIFLNKAQRGKELNKTKYIYQGEEHFVHDVVFKAPAINAENNCLTVNH